MCSTNWRARSRSCRRSKTSLEAASSQKSYENGDDLTTTTLIHGARTMRIIRLQASSLLLNGQEISGTRGAFMDLFKAWTWAILGFVSWMDRRGRVRSTALKPYMVWVCFILCFSELDMESIVDFCSSSIFASSNWTWCFSGKTRCKRKAS